MVFGYLAFMKSLGMIFGYIVPIHIPANIDPLNVRGAATTVL